MLKIENFEVMGWEHAIRGMRNPMNSWEKSDSEWVPQFDTAQGPVSGEFIIGPNDYALMKKLRNAGTDHRKFMRMITVYLDITAPLYWWKEFKTYRAGRKFGDPEPDIIDPELLEMDIETNSCSTMHKIHAKEFTIEDFSCEYLIKESIGELQNVIDKLNYFRDKFINWKKSDFFIDNDQQLVDRKVIWWQMIQLLPCSYNQKRTVMLNYEVLANIYKSRKDHKLDEWRTFCHWIEELPYSELITGYEEE